MIWFKAKTHGWGWYPSTWEGWVVTAGYAALYIASMLTFAYFITREPEYAINIVIFFFLWLGLVTAAMFWVCYKKGEKH